MTPTDIKEADAVASLLEIKPTDGFRHAFTGIVEHFVSHLIDTASIGWRTSDWEIWHDVLARIAKGPVEAAEVLAAERNGSLPSPHARVVEALRLDEFEPPNIAELAIDDAAVAITRAYQQLADRAAAILQEDHGPPPRGHKSDPVLDLFVFLICAIATMERPIPSAGSMVDGVATALALAVNRTRAELERRGECQAASRRLDQYYEMKDDAIRKRIATTLAAISEGRHRQETAPDAIRANGQN